MEWYMHYSLSWGGFGHHYILAKEKQKFSRLKNVSVQQSYAFYMLQSRHHFDCDTPSTERGAINFSKHETAFFSSFFKLQDLSSTGELVSSSFRQQWPNSVFFFCKKKERNCVKSSWLFGESWSTAEPYIFYMNSPDAGRPSKHNKWHVCRRRYVTWKQGSMW
jgi:hypothetical protein